MGYGFNSTLNLDSIPSGLKYLLNEYKNEILSIKENQTTSSPGIKEKWEMYSVPDSTISMKSYNIGSYLLNTIWDQGSSYQQDCPKDPITQSTSLVGCGGVTLGQILFYWGCRVFPDGSVSYLPDNFQNNISMNFYGQTYNWSTMHVNSPDSENKKLLHHSAVSLESDFGSSETSHVVAAVPFALWNYWGFNSGTTKNKNDYLSTWTSLLRNEIDNGRPIYYGGTDITISPNKAHVWVVDGYRTSDNKYHCNWGWGGSFNEWFTLTDLTPDIWDFNSSQLAVMGISPKLDACSGLSGESLICYPATVQYSVTIPSTASVSWSKTGNLTPVGVTTNPTFTVSSTSNSGASGTVTATIKNSQNQTFLNRTKTVWVGKPGTPITIPSGYPTFELGLGAYQPISLFKTPGFTGGNINWWSTGSISPDGSTTGSTCTFEAISLGTGNFYVTVQNTCGVSSIGGGTVNVVTGGGGQMELLLSPNPATTETTASIESTSTETIFDETAEWDLEVYSPAQNLKEKLTRLKGKSTKIQTSGWPEGVYVVLVKYKNEILTDKLVVKK